MTQLDRAAVNLALALVMLAMGCTETQPPQSLTISPSELSAKSTHGGASLVKEAPPTEEPLPTADANGDYSGKTGHVKWIVVDPDPNGVNCRWSDDMPTAWYAPDAKLPTLNISQWSVVRRFAQNTPERYLQANLTPAGFATIEDDSGKPWLKISIGSGDKICLVRANSKYVQPVR